jgi:tRNA-uridine 2-sulfurtransferase
VNHTQTHRAVSLISGGLDSMLATQVILDQGIYVEGINFFTGFCVEGHTHAIRQRDKTKNKRNNALWVAEQLGIKLHLIDIVEEYKDVVINPKYGYGAHLNPCLDCKVFMIKKAHAFMIERNFDFIITGEVVGQRPKSQRKETMPVVARESGANDRLLRPLCAKRLPPTLPEQEKWVDREKLYNLSGRGRSAQFELAERFQFKDFAQPAGGCCFLTDKHYAKKLADFWQYQGEKKYELDDVMLLKVGRHIRPNDNFKLIIGREEGENNFLEGYRKQFVHLRIMSHPGPLVLLDGSPNEEDIKLAARISARFSGGRDADKVAVQVEKLDNSLMILTVPPMKSADIPEKWYIG